MLAQARPVAVPEVEVRLEAVDVGADRFFVQRLGLDQLVALVMNVGQVDDGRDELGIEQDAAAIRGRRSIQIPLFSIVELRALEEVRRPQIGAVQEKETRAAPSIRSRWDVVIRASDLIKGIAAMV